MFSIFLWSSATLIFFAAYADGAVVTEVVGAGATFPFRVYDQANAFYNALQSNARITYASMGSGPGRCRLQDWAEECSSGDVAEPTVIDFAGSDAIAASSEYEAYPDLQLYPVLAGAVVPIVNIPGAVEFTLTTRALAEIFRGEITWWNDTKITSTQTAEVVTLLGDNAIEAVVRSSSSGTTFIFKSALSHFDSVFSSTTGVSSGTTWTGLNPTLASSTADYVAGTPFTISYVVLGEAVAGDLLVVDFSVASGTISATEETITAAIVEKGLSFGNNGDDPAHLTADTSGALGLNAWPIVGYTYLAMRKDTIRPGASCANRLEVMNYWNWFLTSSFVSEISSAEGITSLPTSILTPVLDRFRFDIKCNGVRIYKRIARVSAPQFMQYTMSNLVVPQYRGVDFSVSMDLSTREAYQELPGGEDISLVTTGDLKLQPGVAAIPYANVAIGIIYNLCDPAGTYCDSVAVNLDIPILAGLLAGEISRWNDPLLVSRNQWLSSVNEDISVQMLLSNDTTMVELLSILSETEGDITLAPTFTFHATDRAVRKKVRLTPYSVGVTAIFGEALNGVSVAMVKNKADTYIHPSIDSLLSCVEGPTSSCYPLAMSLYLKLPASFSLSERETGQIVVALAQWLVKKSDFILYSGGLTRIKASISSQVLGSITTDGISILRGPDEDVYLDESLAAMGIIVAAVVLIFLLILFVWVVMYRNLKLLKNSQPIFLLLLLFGLVLMISSVFPMSFDDRNSFTGDYDEASESLDFACMAQVWLYFTGFAIAMSALIVKTYRIAAIFSLKTKKIQRKAMTVKDVLPPFFIVNGIVLACLALWQILSPLKWDRQVESYDQHGYPEESSGLCRSDNALYFLTILLVGQFFAYVYGNYLAMQTKDVSSKFAESKWMGYTIMSGLQTSVLTLPIVFVNRGNMDTLYIGKLMNVVLQVLALSVFIFVPKLNDWIDSRFSDGKIYNSDTNTKNTTTEDYNNRNNRGSSYHSVESNAEHAEEFVALPAIKEEGGDEGNAVTVFDTKI